MKFTVPAVLLAGLVVTATAELPAYAADLAMFSGCDFVATPHLSQPNPDRYVGTMTVNTAVVFNVADPVLLTGDTKVTCSVQRDDPTYGEGTIVAVESNIEADEPTTVGIDVMARNFEFLAPEGAVLFLCSVMDWTSTKSQSAGPQHNRRWVLDADPDTNGIQCAEIDAPLPTEDRPVGGNCDLTDARLCRNGYVRLCSLKVDSCGDAVFCDDPMFCQLPARSKQDDGVRGQVDRRTGGGGHVRSG